MSTTKGGRLAPSCQFEDISPQLAAQWLGMNHANRRLIDSNVERIKAIILRGEWMDDSTDAIGLDTDGGVVNGQHRLTAIADGTVTVRCLVVRNVRPEVIKVIDQGMPRNLMQILQMTGKYTHAGELSAAIQWLWRIANDFEKTQPAASRPTVPQLLEFFDIHPHLVDSVQVSVETATSVKGLSAGWLAAYHYLMSTVDTAAADEFFVKLETGSEIQAGDPIHAFREKVLANSTATKPEKTTVIQAWMIKAWEAERAGQSMTKATLKWVSKGARAEDFPKLSGVGFDIDGGLVDVTEDAAA